MGILGKTKSAALVTVLRKPFTCLVCGGREFISREILLNTAGMEIFDLAWANRSSLGVVCTTCGHIHEFMLAGKVEFWTISGGYPAAAVG